MINEINYGPDDLKKIKMVVDLGVTTKMQVKDLNEGFRETLNEVSKELELDKKILKKAIMVAYKAQLKGTKEAIVSEEQNNLEYVSFLLDSITK